MISTTNRSIAFGPAGRARVRGGFTLLEILVAMALVAVLLAGVSSVIRLFSGHYSATERQIGRAQLSRSISQMLSDDLGAAVQDPISSLDDDPNRQFVRRFGLRGDSRSLQIDVVQPNLFATTATPEENRRVASGGRKSAESRQVPELKTIFYEFVPINAPEKSASDAANEIDAASASAPEDGRVVSELTGSLLAPPGADAENGAEFFDAAQETPQGAADGAFGWNAARPLARKFGLSRRELDFETPDESASAPNEADVSNVEEDAGLENFASQLGGSLSAPPDASKSTLASGIDAQDGANDAPARADGGSEAEIFAVSPPPTAAQIAMDADDGTSWAPEVLDCRFRYFDGERWFDSWDSIEKAGLPIAIRVELKLAPLDDVDLYRFSPALARLPVPPSPEEIAKIAAGRAAPTNSTEIFSATTGSATSFVATPGATGIDAFNSYRPLSAFRAAQNAPALLGANGVAASRTASEPTRSADSTDSASPRLDLVGGSNSAAAANSNANASGAANFPVFNERGVCVDYANDGSYLTLEQIASELGLSEPTVCEVVAYLPTTPFGRTETLTRRRPANVRRGTVAVRDATARESAAERSASGRNPYATGRARQVQDRTRSERTPNVRTVADRSAADRSAADRSAADRSAADRSAADRSAADRSAATRGVENRSAETREGVSRRSATRAVADRSGAERAVANRRLAARGAGAGTSLDAELATALDAEGGVFGASVGGATEEFSETEPVGGVGAPDAAGLGATALGGWNGGGADAFASTETSDVPFSSGDVGFAAVDAANGTDGTTFLPGLVETSSRGAATTASPTTRGAETKQTRQTWIRGKK